MRSRILSIGCIVVGLVACGGDDDGEPGGTKDAGRDGRAGGSGGRAGADASTGTGGAQTGVGGNHTGGGGAGTGGGDASSGGAGGGGTGGVDAASGGAGGGGTGGVDAASGGAGGGGTGGVDAASGGAGGGGTGGVDASSDGASGGGTGGADAGSGGTGGADASSDGASAGSAGVDASSDGEAGMDAEPGDASSADSADDAAVDLDASDGAVPCTCVHGTCDTSNGKCTNGSCQVGWSDENCDKTGLGLYWKFDEASGPLAIDSSGNGLNGTYVAAPTPAPGVVPASMVSWDTTSLNFQMATRQAVQLASADGGVNLAPVQPANNFTVAAWYKVGVADLDTQGADLVSMGDHYVLRLFKSSTEYRLEFTKYVLPGDGGAAGFTQCRYIVGVDAGVPTFLDGNWHHFAAISTNVAPGLQIYFDGNLLPAVLPSVTHSPMNDVYYGGRGTDLWSGRHGFSTGPTNNVDRDLNGNLDEVRIYDRVLRPAEITALAAGIQLP